MVEKTNSKKIKIVTGDGKLDISLVTTHLNVEKPTHKIEKEKIIIPKSKK